MQRQSENRRRKDGCEIGDKLGRKLWLVGSGDRGGRGGRQALETSGVKMSLTGPSIKQIFTICLLHTQQMEQSPDTVQLLAGV